MAAALWGKIYYNETYAGVLQQEPGGRFAFTYDASYIAGKHPAIAFTLPLQEKPHYCEAGLHPFFDNLVAEGWLRNAQARALGVNRENRFALLLAFGRDCAGAVSVIDPEPVKDLQVDATDPERVAALASRASLSGIQPKLLVVKEEDGSFRPASAGETSTHLAKLPSGQLPNIIDIECLSTEATRALLPGEPVVDLEIAPLGKVAPKALMIRRFDRTPNKRKLHFEEFNQLLGHLSDDKYDGSYEGMAQFIRSTPACIPAEAERVFRRVLACLLIGNTDAHQKNFAMMHTLDGLRLAPAYDLLASSFYEDFQTVALALGGARDLKISAVRPKHIITFGEDCGLRPAAILSIIEDLGKRVDAAKEAVKRSNVGSERLRDEFIENMEKRWNGTFASIGSFLSKRHDKEEKLKD